MSLLRVKIEKILFKNGNYILFNGSYEGGAKTFSPRGFRAWIEVKHTPFSDGDVFIEANYNWKILEHNPGHEKVIQEVLKTLSEFNPR